METAFVLKYGEHEPPRNDEAWYKIETGVGASVQYDACMDQRHEFEWCDEVLEHICYFCLCTQETGDSDHCDPEEQPPATEEKNRGRKRKRSEGPGSDDDEKYGGALEIRDIAVGENQGGSEKLLMQEGEDDADEEECFEDEAEDEEDLDSGDESEVNLDAGHWKSEYDSDGKSISASDIED